jgi:hypothetical protein|tara:strand:- start:95 stop:229 length:135 start_codon:yes stop_codon:yes gene_type:complete
MIGKRQKAKIKKVAKKLRGASKAHAGQAKTLESMLKKTKRKRRA